MIDDCCGAGDVNESVICALFGLFTVVTAADAQFVGAMPIVKYADGTCHRVSGAQLVETPWLGVSDDARLIITPGDTPGGPAGNGHTPRFTLNLPPPPESGDYTAGCGIAINGSRVVSARTSGTWGWPCADTSGSPIYCDSNGQLRGVPEHTAVASPRVVQGVHWGAVGVGSYSVPASMFFANPSSCRSMACAVQYTMGMQDASPSGWTAGGLTLAIVNNTMVGANIGNYTVWGGNPAAVAFGTSFLITLSEDDLGTLPPGGSTTIQISGRIDVASGSTGNADGTCSISVFGVTQ